MAVNVRMRGSQLGLPGGDSDEPDHVIFKSSMERLHGSRRLGRQLTVQAEMGGARSGRAYRSGQDIREIRKGGGMNEDKFKRYGSRRRARIQKRLGKAGERPAPAHPARDALMMTSSPSASAIRARSKFPKWRSRTQPVTGPWAVENGGSVLTCLPYLASCMPAGRRCPSWHGRLTGAKASMRRLRDGDARRGGGELMGTQTGKSPCRRMASCQPCIRHASELHRTPRKDLHRMVGRHVGGDETMWKGEGARGKHEQDEKERIRTPHKRQPTRLHNPRIRVRAVGGYTASTARSLPCGSAQRCDRGGTRFCRVRADETRAKIVSISSVFHINARTSRTTRARNRLLSPSSSYTPKSAEAETHAVETEGAKLEADWYLALLDRRHGRRSASGRHNHTFLALPAIHRMSAVLIANLEKI
ncbi:hypothetical protein DFH09DRAFT_1269710 [Mycena vulgaris]|nr:hypothetical protein DFH09DRAFT_1269710 [Mycena vulgaris]